MSTVTSEDGTPIAYERKGSGAAVGRAPRAGYGPPPAALW